MDSSLQFLLQRLDQLSDQFRELREGVQKAVRIADEDPEMALTRARKVLEYVIREVYERRIQEPPGTRPLENLLQRLVKDGHFPDRLDAYANTVRKLGNVGTHTFGEKVTVRDVHLSLSQLLPILEWYFEVEHPEAMGDVSARFRESGRARDSGMSGLVAALPLGGEGSGVRGPAVQPGSSRNAARAVVIPKGLRSFDAKDADFFLELLPGPRDKDGLPESIRFWKHRIEPGDEPAFAVGIIYGPSGCGKSSLVKAGLLPRLNERVLPVYVEATAEDTETRLLQGLRNRCPSSRGDLIQALTALRQGSSLPAGQKVLFVIDQFEQWLHAKASQSNTDLALALRQCDGQHLQCMVLVRDDFWMALNRFMQDLHIELLQGQNVAVVDLFDQSHARNVLTAFGRAFERLENPTKEQNAFLDQAVTGLARDGRVISVRLALFAEMVKARPWTPATLKAVGGTEGVGVSFLEETFGASANARHRPHQKAAQAVLKTLLPEQGSDIKGNMRSHTEMLQASGYVARPKDFDDLVRILDSELRLITPTESMSGSGGRHYQLTHDYLVPALREWLTRKQKETRRGRAELVLADRASIWITRRETRQLPSLWQWLAIRVWTRKGGWTEPQRKMMAKAGRYHAARLTAAGLLLAVAAVAAMTIQARVVQENNATHADGLVRRLLDADTAQIPDIIRAMADYRQWTDPLLWEENGKAADKSPQKLRASLALLPVDPTQIGYLYGQLLEARPAELVVIREALAPHKDALQAKLWALVENPEKGKQRLRAAAALDLYDAGSSRWPRSCMLLVNELLSENALGQWSEMFKEVKKSFLAPLTEIFRDHRPERAGERILATNLLADYAADDAKLLGELVMDADEKQFAVVAPKLKGHGAAGLAILSSELTKQETAPTVTILQKKGEQLRAEDQPVKVEGVTGIVSLPAKGYPLAMTAGRAYSITMTSTDLEPFLVLQDKAGKQLAYKDGGGGPKALLQYVPTADGDYQVYSAFYKGGMGSYSLEVVETDAREQAKEKLTKRQVNAAVALLRLGQEDSVWPLLQRSPDNFDDPRLRSYLVHSLLPLGADAGAILKRLVQERDASVRRALILSLGEHGNPEIPAAVRTAAVPTLKELYQSDSDAGIHAAAEWLLREWEQTPWLNEVNKAWARKEQRDLQLDAIRERLKKPLLKASAPARATWYVNTGGQTLVVIPGPVEFLMGSPSTEANRLPDEVQHRQRIGRTFAIAAKPVTVEQYSKWDKGYRSSLIPDYVRSEDMPAVLISWYDAARYCNWLSEQEGIDEDQWCYQIGKGAQDVKLKPQYLSLEGYRMPTEPEMEYATRAGAITARYYGETEDLLPQYAWYSKTAQGKACPVGRLRPNDFGLFDAHGNVFAWCIETWLDYSRFEKIAEDTELIGRSLDIDAATNRMLRGGSHLDQARAIRSSNRYLTLPARRYVTVGLRVARTLTIDTASQ